MKLKPFVFTLLALVCGAIAAPGDTARKYIMGYSVDTCGGNRVCRYSQIALTAGVTLSDTTALMVGPKSRYTTIDAAIYAGSLRNVPLIVSLDPNGTYSTVGGNFPAIPMVIYGNGATVTLTNPVRVNASWRAYDLSITGNVCFNGASTSRYYLTGGTTTGTDTINAGYLHYEERSLTGGSLIQNGGTVKIIGTSVSSTIAHKAGSLQISTSNFTGTQAGALITSTASGATDNVRVLGGSFTNSGAGTIFDFAGNSVTTAGANSLHGASFKTTTAASIIGGTELITVADCDVSIVPTGTKYRSPNWAGLTLRAVTATKDTANINDAVLTLSGTTADTIQLPTTFAGRMVTIKRTDANTTAHRILGTIDGNAAYVMSWPYESVQIIATSTNTFSILGGH
jgi:hypothetical protein